MTLRPRLVAALVTVACVGSVIWSWSRASSARSGAQAEHGRLVSLQTDVEELTRLRSLEVHAHADQPSEDDLLARVRQTLIESGINESALTQMTRPGDQSVGGADRDGGSPYARRTERVVLEPLLLADLGRWLQVWRSTEPLWVVSLVEMRSIRGTESSGAYAVTVDLTTTFVRDQARAQP